MTDAVAISIVTVVGGLVTLVVTRLLNRLDRKLDSYHKEVDGMKTELVEAVRGRAQSEGEQKGAADNQAATDAKNNKT